MPQPAFTPTHPADPRRSVILPPARRPACTWTAPGSLLGAAAGRVQADTAVRWQRVAVRWQRVADPGGVQRVGNAFSGPLLPVSRPVGDRLGHEFEQCCRAPRSERGGRGGLHRPSAGGMLSRAQLKRSGHCTIRSEQPRLPLHGVCRHRCSWESPRASWPHRQWAGSALIAAPSACAAGTDMLGTDSWAVRLEVASFRSATGELVGRRHLPLPIPSLLSDVP